MGISSNQARLMTLTARQHDLELRAQQISAQKMIKGLESQEAAMEYSRALQNYSTLKQIAALPKRVANPNGNLPEHNYAGFYENGVYSYREIRPDENLDDFNNFATFGEGLLYELTFTDGIEDVEYYLETAKAKYNKFTASLSAEEKLLDMELTQINTEHSAVKTEYDSVKGLVGENVDKSFNVFS